LPQLSLALEYQGETHYFSSHTFGNASSRQRADLLKVNFASEMGITLIPIPFWWDKSSNSLAATIHVYRPDVIPASGTKTLPISPEIPDKYRGQVKYVPRTFVEYNDQVDPAGW
jgi:hypothetical protein